MKSFFKLKMLISIFVIASLSSPSSAKSNEADRATWEDIRLGRCITDVKEFKEAFGKITKYCANKESLEKCQKKHICSGDEDSEVCEGYSKEELNNLKEENKDYEQAKKDLEEDIAELESDMLEKKGEISTKDAEYQEDVTDLNNTLLDEKNQLDIELKEKKQKLDSSTQEKIDVIQKQLQNGLKTQHAFENALSDAEEKRISAIQGLMAKCRKEASERLSSYRAKRRSNIRRGINKKPALKMLSRNRVSLKTIDSRRSKSYYDKCWKESKPLLKQVFANYKKTIRRIEQQKQQMLHEFNTLQKEATTLNQRAMQEKQTLVADYAKRTELKTTKFNNSHAARTRKYTQEKQDLTSEIVHLNGSKQKKVLALQDKSYAFDENQVLISELKESKTSKTKLDAIMKAVNKRNDAEIECNCGDDDTEEKFRILCSKLEFQTKDNTGSSNPPKDGSAGSN